MKIFLILIVIALLLQIVTLILIHNPSLIPVPDKILKARECQIFCWDNGYIYSEYLGKEGDKLICKCSSDDIVLKKQKLLGGKGE